MMKIKKLADEICEELDGAKEYAEKYIEYKAAGESSWAAKFKDMANDELKHAMVLHELAVKEIDTVSKVFTAPAEMQEAWEKSHKNYVEKSAWIKQMLAM